MSLLFKHLARHLVADLPALLRHSRGLRYARARHVRAFAAQAAGFLLRVAAAGVGSGSEPAGAAAAGGVPAALRAAVRAVLAEQAQRPSLEVTEGAGLLLAEAVLGVGHGLHSRAPLILELLLGEDLLAPSDFGRKQAQSSEQAQGASGAAGSGKEGRLGREQLRARAAAVATVALDRVLSHVRRGKCGLLWSALLKEAHRRLDRLEGAAEEAGAGAGAGGGATAAAAPATAGGKSGKAAKKGKGATSTAAAAAEPADTAEAGEGVAAAHVSEAVQEAGASSARAVALVAQAVHYYRGSRVEDYAPVHVLLTRLMSPWAWVYQPGSAAVTVAVVTAGATEGAGVASSAKGPATPVGKSPATTRKRGRGAAAAAAAAAAEEAQPEAAADAEQGQGAEGATPAPAEPFLRPSLTGQSLRLVLGVVWGHSKVVGASEGIPALVRHAPTWAPCFSRAPAHELMPFVAGLVSPPGGPEVAKIFGPRLVGALGSLVVMTGTAAAQQQQQGHKALGLLVEVCSVLEPAGGAAAARASVLPLLLTAQPGGVKLAAAVRQQLSAWASAVTEAAAQGPAALVAEPAMQTQQTAAAWAALSLMPHACESAAQALQACEAAQAAAAAAVHALQGQQEHAQQQQQQQGGNAHLDGLLCVHGGATELLAALLPSLPSGSETRLATLASAALDWLKRFPGSLWAARGAAAALQAAREHAAPSSAAARKLLSTGALEALLPALAPHLAHPSQAMRAALLRVLCAFDTHALTSGPGSQPASTPAPSLAGPVIAGPSASEAVAAAAAAATGGRAGEGGSGKRYEAKSEVLELLRAINSEPCSLEAGRRWSVALIRQVGRGERCVV